MVEVENIKASTKQIGKYEEKIIRCLTRYFHGKGYEVIPHSRLNVAWGSILSDIDLLTIKDGKLAYVEVKSRRDKLRKAFQQIEHVKDYIDYAYIATDKLINNWNFPDIGLILIKNNSVVFEKKPSRFRNRPSFSSIMSLKKKCLTRFLGNGRDYRTYSNKYVLAKYVYTVRNSECTRECLKEIVTCGENCDIFCPIEKFIETISPVL